MHTQLLIGGRLIAGEGPEDAVLDAATGAELVRVAAASVPQVEAAVAAAERAFEGWARTAPKDRAALLLKIADGLERQAADYAALESRNTGKPLAAMISRMCSVTLPARRAAPADWPPASTSRATPA
jgi:aminobutyraldehyde dehydrogenase